MKTLDPIHVGIILGLFFGSLHLIWSVFVAIGLAGWWLDFVTSVHFLSNPFTLQVFDPVRALTLIVVTTVVGFVYGYLFAFIWNKVHKMVK
ncbi:hypothetical protein HYW54_03890 [Candidatus Gottesmanbacteria bacterium]|nr:hypothetical protein [Candidatus Gottesmanbacteria bacterium]